MSDDGQTENKGEEAPVIDPLLGQAERLPAFKRGTDPYNPAEHVRPATGNADEHQAPSEDDDLDDGFGYQPPDPGNFTADS